LQLAGSAFAQSSTSGKKILVAYFSQAGEQYGVGVITEGNTSKLAKVIAKKLKSDGAMVDLFHIEADKFYPTKYKPLTEVAKEELNKNERPRIKGKVPNITDYDEIFLGYPIWWGDMPMTCYTFLEGSDFSGKKIYPFCTHAGSGTAGTQARIQKAVPKATVSIVLAVSGTTAQNDAARSQKEVDAWFKKIGK